MYWAIKYTGISTFERPMKFSVSNILNKSPGNGEPPEGTISPRFHWISSPLVFQDKYISHNFLTAPKCDFPCMADFLK